MTAEIIVALAVVVPVILFPAVFVWYMTIGGLVEAAREARRAKATAKAEVTT